MSTFHKRNRPSVNCLYDFLLAWIFLVSNSSCDFYDPLKNNISFSDWQFKYNAEDHRGFPLAFSSVVRQMPRETPQRRGTVRSLPKNFCCFIYCLFCVVLCSVCVCVCVCKRVLYYGHRVTIQLQLTNISFHYFRFCVLRSGDSH